MWNSNSVQKLEDDIMKSWGIVDDLDLLLNYVGDDPFFSGMKAEHQDKLMNILIGVKEMSDIKFQNMWTTYQSVVKDYYKYKRIHDNEE